MVQANNEENWNIQEQIIGKLECQCVDDIENQFLVPCLAQCCC